MESVRVDRRRHHEAGRGSRMDRVRAGFPGRGEGFFKASRPEF